MKVIELLDLFDDHNIDVVINDKNLKLVKKESIWRFISNTITNSRLHREEVVSFGFYDGELTIRVNKLKEDL